MSHSTNSSPLLFVHYVLCYDRKVIKAPDKPNKSHLCIIHPSKIKKKSKYNLIIIIYLSYNNQGLERDIMVNH